MAKYKLQEMSSLNASLELKELTRGEDAPFDFRGRGSHKIWVPK